MSKPARENVSDKLLPVLRRIYERHGAGCCWHCVTEDGNWCLVDQTREYALGNDPDRTSPCVTEGACQELARMDFTSSILARAKRKLDKELYGR